VHGEEVQLKTRLPWRMTVLGLAIFGCLAAAGWFALPRKSEVPEKASGRFPAASQPGTPAKKELSSEQNGIPLGGMAIARMVQPSREEILAKAIEIEYAL